MKKKCFYIYFVLLVFSHISHAQYYTIGHEQMVDPVVATKQKYYAIESVELKGDNMWDKTNFNSFSVLLFDGASPVHEIVYQTDSWGKLCYFGITAGLNEIVQSAVFPKARFQMEAKKTDTLFEGKERVLEMLRLLVSMLNEMSF